MAAHQVVERPSGMRRGLEVAAVILAACLQLLAGWFTTASGLMAPLGGILVLGLVWVAAVVVLVRVARRRPLLAPLVPLANAAVWFAVMTAGEAWLGWRP